MSKKSSVPPLLFSTTDFYGNLVELRQKTWATHVLDEHPEMAGYEMLVQEVLRTPDEIRVSTKYAFSVAFVSDSGLGPSPEGIRVLVDYSDSFYEKGSTLGQVSTAYPIDIIKYGYPQLARTIYKKGNEMTLSYDKDADVLYVTFEKFPGESYLYVENANGDILRLDKETRRVVGCTIPGFSKRTATEKVTVPEVGYVPFNESADDLVSQ